MDGWRTRLLFDRARLWRITRMTVFAGTPLVTASLFACGTCGVENRIYLLRSPDAQVQALIDQCRQPQGSCAPLCRHLLGSDGRRYALPGSFDHCELHSDRDGYLRVHVGWQEPCPGGRRPEGVLLPAVQADATGAGAWLGQLAALEAASVPAFERLAVELAAHGAPRSLVRAAAASADEEVVHARVVTALAARYGTQSLAPEVPVAQGVRPLVDVLVENAVEGCVREAYGAILAAHQATAAADPVLRAAFRRIAYDEHRHAALALAIDDWGHNKVPGRDRRRLAAEKALAANALLTEVSTSSPPKTSSVTLGLPGPDRARHIVTALREQTCSVA